MKLYQYITMIMIVIAAVTLVPGGVVQAFPPLPSSFHGRIKLNGANLPAGTTIQALISDQVYATSTIELYQGDSVYSLIVPGDDPGTAVVEGAQQGSVISFQVNGLQADQTATWQSGTSVALDLTITTNTNLPTSTLSVTPGITQTGTLPPGTSTPTLQGSQTGTVQPTITGTQAPSETQQESEESAYPGATEDLPAETNENIIPTQTPGGSVGNTGEGSDLSSPDQKDGESVQESDHRKTWSIIGIAGVALVIIGTVGWFLKKRKRPDQDLL